MAGPHYLLDTNIIFHWSASTRLAEHVRITYHLDDPAVRPSISIVTMAEIMALATYLGWGRGRMDRLNELLDSLVHVDINQPEVFNSYIDLYQIARQGGRNLDEKNQNDLWIAACAVASQSKLLTTDKDFHVFPQSALSWDWIDPDAFPEK